MSKLFATLEYLLWTPHFHTTNSLLPKITNFAFLFFVSVSFISFSFHFQNTNKFLTNPFPFFSSRVYSIFQEEEEDNTKFLKFQSSQMKLLGKNLNFFIHFMLFCILLFNIYVFFYAICKFNQYHAMFELLNVYT